MQADQGLVQAYLDNSVTSLHWNNAVMSYRELLEGYHDFLLCARHRLAPPDAHELAVTIPARMWERGFLPFIATCMSVQSRNDPHVSEHISTFLLLAYNMAALLLEVVPELQDHWLEHLGHLAGYRANMEFPRTEERYHWLSVSRSWYFEACWATFGRYRVSSIAATHYHNTYN